MLSIPANATLICDILLLTLVFAANKHSNWALLSFSALLPINQRWRNINSSFREWQARRRNWNYFQEVFLFALGTVPSLSLGLMKIELENYSCGQSATLIKLKIKIYRAERKPGKLTLMFSQKRRRKMWNVTIIEFQGSWSCRQTICRLWVVEPTTQNAKINGTLHSKLKLGKFEFERWLRGAFDAEGWEA